MTRTVVIAAAFLFACARGGSERTGDDSRVNTDPCQGVACKTPPPNACSDADSIRIYDDEGTCADGTCSYTSMDKDCPKGCVSDICVECQTTPDCPSGKWCTNMTCAACNTNQHCGPSCTDCTATGDYCNGASTACVDCLQDNQCAAGNYCNANTCAACNVAAHCGPSCVACSGTTPVCSGTACVCNSTSCGAYNQCTGGACAHCASTSACGATCAPCGGSTPYCLDEGATSRCVECLSNANCTGGKTCSNGTCVAACSAPAAACGSAGDQDGSCSGAYTISRADAAAGFHINDDYGMCGRANDFPSVSGCESGGSSNGADAAYRLFMKTGETAHIALTRGASTCLSSWSGTISLKIYGTACSADCSSCANTCGTLHYCMQSNSQSTNFVAPVSGWYDIVVDTRGAAGDDIGGVFDLQVSLTCAGACTCP